MHEEVSSQLDFNYDNHRGNRIEERYGNDTFNYQNKGLYKNEAGGYTISSTGLTEGSYLDQSDSLLLQKEIKGQYSLFDFNYNQAQPTRAKTSEVLWSSFCSWSKPLALRCFRNKQYMAN